MNKRLVLIIVFLLSGCQSRSDRFDDAWNGSCYVDPVMNLPVGWPIPGAPGQIYTNRTKDPK